MRLDPERMWRMMLIFVAILTACGSDSFEEATRAYGEERYADAYKAYAEVLVSKAKPFKRPEFNPEDEISQTIKVVSARLVSFLIKRATEAQCESSFDRLRSLEKEITYEEMRSHVTTDSITEDRYRKLLGARFSDQRSLPAGATEEIEALYDASKSIVLVHPGDNAGVAYVEGAVYSVASGEAYSVEIPPDLLGRSAALLLMPPGECVLVVRARLDLSDQQNLLYLRLNGIEGRWRAHFFDVPDSPHLIEVRLDVGS